jgi:hypothetical protein
MPLPGNPQIAMLATVGSLLAEQEMGWPEVADEVFIHLPPDSASAEVFQGVLLSLRRKQHIRIYTDQYVTCLSSYAIAYLGRWHVIGRSSYHRRILIQPMSEIRSAVRGWRPQALPASKKI